MKCCDGILFHSINLKVFQIFNAIENFRLIPSYIMSSEEEQARVEAERAVTRSGYRKLMDQIADNEEDIVDVNGETNHLLQFLQNNEELYKEVDAPQEAVMDAVVVKHLSRLCKKQAENMSTK